MLTLDLIEKMSSLEDKRIVHFNNMECIIVKKKYLNGRIHLSLVDVKDGMQAANVTLNIDTVPVIDDMVIIKDYRENAGIYTALLAAGIIKPCERKISVGFDYGLICFLSQ